jgi:hypothetical protein
MENRQQQILSEIKEMMSSIRVQLEQLDAKMAELQYEVDPQCFTMDPIDLNLDELPVVSDAVGPVAEPVLEPVAEVVMEPVADDLPFFDEPETEHETVFQPEQVSVAEPVTVHVAAQAAAAEKTVVLDAMTARQAWRTDMPGASVRDIRSAISLNDRVLFINRLFGEDPVAFQETLTAVNQMETLDAAVEYLVQKYPLWNLDSELVYRFMMALRRKLN